MNTIYRKIFVILFLFTLGIYAYSQSSSADYREMRDKARNLFIKGQYAESLRIYDGASGFITNVNNFGELNRLRQELRDTVRSIYNRTISLAHNARTETEYIKAIQKFKSLLPADGQNIPFIYSWIGHCFEKLKEPYSALEQYERGLAHDKEYFSAMRLAELLPKYRKISEDSIAALYEIAALHDATIYENVGDIYEKTNPAKAYTYYSKSGTNRGKYQMAAMILSGKIHVLENPIDILKELSDKNYADAQFYLGLLYFQGSNRLSQNVSLGLSLIEKAAKGECKDAANWLKARNRELRTY